MFPALHQSENRYKFLLLSLIIGLMIIHLNLVDRSNDSDLFSCSLLFWLTVGYLIWSQGDRLNLIGDFFSHLVGLFLLGFLLIKTLNVAQHDIFLRIYPLLAILSFILFASGFKSLKKYQYELLLVGFLAIPWEFVYLFIDLSLLTAKFSNFLLWICGFTVKRQGIMLILPTGTIEVYNGCSGLRLIIQLLGIALIFIAILKPSLVQKIIIAITAIILGFTVNSIRVALMTILVGLGDKKAFLYWHVGTGSLWFSLLSVALLGMISTKFISKNYSNKTYF
jgi:cyanoexosortase A